MNVRPYLRFLALSAAMGLLAPIASAGDGVIEINQVKALAGGVTPNDAPGFPVILTQRGSYRLSSNLDLSVVPNGAAPNTHAIQVNAGGTIDLNGFTILGVGNCINNVCTLTSGSGTGVFTGQEVTVRNGTIRGMGAFGLQLGAGSRAEGVTVEHNRLGGMFIVGNSGRVSNCSASFNGGAGFSLKRNSSIRDSVASDNGGPGFEISGGAVIGCASARNAGFGFFMGDGVLVNSAAESTPASGIPEPAHLATVLLSRTTGGRPRFR